MSLTLAEQLSAFPLLSTVLRVDFELYDAEGTFERTASILRDWANQKSLQFGAALDEDTENLSRAAERFRLEFCRSTDSWTLFLEHPDSREESRSWICEIALEKRGGGTRFSTRLSHRQPMERPLPLPRAPKYISGIVRAVGAVDDRVLEGTPQRIGTADIASLTDLLESKRRRLPVLVVSDDDLLDQPACSPERLADFHCGIAHVVHLDTGGAWSLSNLWGPEWSTYRGAVRCYLPGLDHSSSDPRLHRLWFGQTIRRLDASRADGFLNQSLKQVFVTVTAQFEPFPLLSPAALRRQVAESAQAESVADPSESTIVPSSIAALAESFWTDTMPLPAVDDSVQRGAAEERERSDRLQVDLGEKISILTVQLQVLEGQLQEARNQSAQERVQFENLQDELDLYGQVNSELQLKVDVLTGKRTEDSSEVVRALWTSFSEFFQSIQNLSTQYKRVEAESAEKEQIQGSFEEAKLEIHSLRAQVEILKFRKPEAPSLKAELQLNDSDSLRAFFTDQPYGRIEVLPSAAKSYRDYPFNDLERMTEGLLILRDLYLPMKLAVGDEGSKLHEKFQSRIEVGKFRFGPTAKEATRKHNEEDHTVKLPDGRRIACEKIRDKTTNMNWQFYFGVYFAWDEKEKTLYVKAFGHGDSPSART
jgi:hypothetical protein